jgi:hypothetical protein
MLGRTDAKSPIEITKTSEVVTSIAISISQMDAKSRMTAPPTPRTSETNATKVRQSLTAKSFISIGIDASAIAAAINVPAEPFISESPER